MATAALTAGAPDWTEAFHSHRPRMLGLALVIVRNEDDAADVVQSAFEKAFRHRRRFDDASPVGPWLAKITCNEAISFLRRRRVRSWVLVRDEDASVSVEAATTDRLVVEAALRRLDPRHRAVVGLFYLHGYGIDEVGQILAIPRGTVASRLNRARAVLRETLNDTPATKELR